jgi:hypothetical protein
MPGEIVSSDMLWCLNRVSMKNVLRFAGFCLVACTNSAHAIEASANAGPQAAQSAVTSINNTFTAQVAALQTQVSNTLTCNKVRKFYVPGDSKQDAHGCVGVQDYSVTMSSGAAFGTTDQPVSGNSVGTPGVLGTSTNNYGVNGQSTNSWAGVFSSPNYGVYGQGTTYGVYSAGPLCVNGSCISNWSSAGSFGGEYGTWNGTCQFNNPITGSCGCPSGFGPYMVMNFTDHTNNWQGLILCVRS